jgi:hypothetical protein
MGGDADLPNLREPVQLDAAGTWAVTQAEAVLCINMVHISPWTATLGLLAGSARVLPPGGRLSSMAISPPRPPDGAKQRDVRSIAQVAQSDWGLRDLGTVIAAAETEELALDRVVEMPANNLSIVLRRI